MPLLRALIAAIAFGLALPASAADAGQPPPPAAAEAPSAPTTRDIEIELELQAQQIKHVDTRLDFQDTRIGDMNAQLSFGLALFGILITGIIIFFSLRAKREAVLEAKEEARQEIERQAANAIQHWLETQAVAELREKIDAEADKVISRINTEAGNILTGLQTEHDRAQANNAKQEQLLEQFSNLGADAPPPTQAQRSALDDSAARLGATPPDQYRFDDWMLLGIRSFLADKFEIALEYFDNAFTHAEEPTEIARALLNKGVTLGRLQRDEAEIACYDTLIARFGEHTEPALQEEVASALFNKGVALGRLQGKEAAIACYDTLISRFGEHPELALQERVASALHNKGTALGQLQCHEAAIACFDALIARFGERAELALQEPVAGALFNKGVTLERLRHDEAAIDCYEAVISRFGKHAEPAIRRQVANAHNGVAFSRLCHAKAMWLTEAERAKEMLEQALDDIARALEITPDEPIVLGNHGYILFLLGRRDEARAVLSRAIELGGEALRKNELDDAKIHPTPQDDDFVALINSL